MQWPPKTAGMQEPFSCPVLDASRLMISTLHMPLVSHLTTQTSLDDVVDLLATNVGRRNSFNLTLTSDLPGFAKQMSRHKLRQPSGCSEQLPPKAGGKQEPLTEPLMGFFVTIVVEQPPFS